MANKDWTGNKTSTYVNIGASNHSNIDREENDYYATSPKAVRLLLERETFSNNIWEPACGENHITKVLRENGYNVKTTDIIDRIGDGTVEITDFLTTNKTFDGDIVTNPPYKFAREFVQKAMETVTDGHKVVMYLKIQFLETSKRYELFKQYPPKYVYVSVRRLGCARNGEFDTIDETVGGATCFCWFVWEKGFSGEPIIRWFNF